MLASGRLRLRLLLATAGYVRLLLLAGWLKRRRPQERGQVGCVAAPGFLHGRVGQMDEPASEGGRWSKAPQGKSTLGRGLSIFTGSRLCAVNGMGQCIVLTCCRAGSGPLKTGA